MWRGLGDLGFFGAAIRRSDASMQFTKLRSGLTWPPFRALLRPTAPTPMPAPTPDRRRHVPKSESSLHQLRDRAGIVSCRPSAGEVPLWGPQTGTSTLTEFRQCAGDRHSTGSVTAARRQVQKMNLFCIRIKSESFLHHLRDRAGIVSCRSSAGEVPLWGAQTGTSTLTKVR